MFSVSSFAEDSLYGLDKPGIVIRKRTVCTHCAASYIEDKLIPLDTCRARICRMGNLTEGIQRALATWRLAEHNHILDGEYDCDISLKGAYQSRGVRPAQGCLRFRGSRPDESGEPLAERAHRGRAGPSLTRVADVSASKIDRGLRLAHQGAWPLHPPGGRWPHGTCETAGTASNPAILRWACEADVNCDYMRAASTRSWLPGRLLGAEVAPSFRGWVNNTLSLSPQARNSASMLSWHQIFP